MNPYDWTAMFMKNREARIKFVKTNRNEDETTVTEEVFNEESAKLIEETGKNLIKHLAVTTVVVVAAIKVIDTLGDIAVKKTKSADHE